MSTEKLLEERGDTYGKFEDNARVSQKLQNTLRRESANYRVNAVQAEALQVICAKLSRIVNGDANYIDNWADIAGYATLVVNDLKENKGLK